MTAARADRGIVFDFAGVLFTWSPPHLLKRELPEHAVDDTSAAFWATQFFQGYEGDWLEFDRGNVSVPALIERIAKRTGLPQQAVQRVVDGVPHELQPIAATVALRSRLRAAGHRLYFLSNMPEPYARHLENRYTFVGDFERGVFSADVHLAKPEPAIFEFAATHFGLPPQQLMFMDDHLPNVTAAQSLGWNAFVFTSAAQAEAELRTQGWID
jgi:putative hydrolase of the HAD superfamily